MANKIDATMSQQYLNITGSTGRTAPSDASQARKSGGSGTVEGTGTPSTDTVELTQSARQMHALESAIGDVTVVDQARVDEVRARLDEGRYDASAQRTADRMLAFDRALPKGE